jgi:UDP-glucose-4-epimerase GalE
MNKKILVTGGAGYIGSHTCKILADAGYEPIVFDNLSTGNQNFVRWGPLIIGDICNIDQISHALAKINPIAVFHLAARSNVGESSLNPLKYYENNVAGTITLLSAMKKSGILNLVYSSSCATYGEQSAEYITETLPQIPINPYGRSKHMAEQIMLDLSQRNELNYVSLRFFNAAGADESGDLGEDHDPETHLIPLSIKAGLTNTEVCIYGNKFLTPDGTAVRDYTHVNDIGRAHLCALKYLQEGNNSDSFNLGTGVGTSVLKVIQTIKNLGLDIKYKFCENRCGDPAQLVANPSKAKRILKWEAKYKSIDEIIESALVWHKKY